MKKLSLISLVTLICLLFSGCSLIKGAMKKIPLFEEADIDSLTDKAEKAWEEVGKETLQNAAGDAADALKGSSKKLSWPDNETTKGIPKVSIGTISKIDQTDNICEITIEEVSQNGYTDYISNLNKSIGEPATSNLYRLDDRLLSVVYDEDMSKLVITISVIKQTISFSEDPTSSDEIDDESSLEDFVSDDTK